MEPYKPSSSSTSGQLSEPTASVPELGLPVRRAPINIAGVAGDGAAGRANPAPQAHPRHRSRGSAAAPQQGIRGGSVSALCRKPGYVVSLPDPGTVLAQVTPTYQTSTQAQWALSPSRSAPRPARPTSASLFGTPTGQTAPQQQQPASAPQALTLPLSQISDQSLEVLEHFGLKLPASTTTPVLLRML